ncbi:hypothetical protein TUZN_1300 [Thermoproteus uzoniensis 768-20]|uniref:Uncharacterized protein n=1 Tax=Thermoproteus uzoniensis (strain 768-20) TaxID=999630 RepID=F2L0W1_THEU7|nr:hypothetical protein [Thermoproteus uzoniensis]AEA12776.1 hypothetical protein TUZN_1300 [Thermoproteus uzoniensis 768-20]
MELSTEVRGAVEVLVSDSTAVVVWLVCVIVATAVEVVILFVRVGVELSAVVCSVTEVFVRDPADGAANL